MTEALERLYDLFQDAPELGSLIDPRSAAGEGLWAVDVDDLLARLDRALARETAADPAASVFGSAAAGTAKAAQLLAGEYCVVATNPPFLTRQKQSPRLRELLDRSYYLGRADLSAAFLLRCRKLAAARGFYAMVNPQSVLFQPAYRGWRLDALASQEWHVLAKLGTGAFAAIGGEIVNAALLVIGNAVPGPAHEFSLIDVSDAVGPRAKSDLLRAARLGLSAQDIQSAHPDARIYLGATDGELLSAIAESRTGTRTADNARLLRYAWEITVDDRWEALQSTVRETTPFGGREQFVLWERGQGALAELDRIGLASIQGQDAWGRQGIAVSLMGGLPVTLYRGNKYDMNCGVIWPRNQEHLSALWAFCASPEFNRSVRVIDQQLKLTTATLIKVPFDLEQWQRVAAEQYPNGLPEPYTEDPTQWLFKGIIVGSEAPLQVAVARLLGYRWPDQQPDALDEMADPDGLVPLVSVSGERPAAERLRVLLSEAYGEAWSPALLERLLAEAGSPGSTLEAWLRDDFFTQHTRLFAQRPFIWHVWDGRKDGFSALCHYHRLDRARLEKLTYTLLGDWIERQRIAGDEPGAEARLIAAERLQDQLSKVLEGDAPFDVYVRWKSLAEQSIGWEPDVDDGVRLNIRPFVIAGVLRAKVNVKWEKDRGKNPDGSERINDLHPTLAEKRSAQAMVSQA